MQQRNYCLTWPTHSDHLKSMMKELMMNEDFSDVTLVTEDKKQINANISVLSACSPVFKDILKKEKNTLIKISLPKGRVMTNASALPVQRQVLEQLLITDQKVGFGHASLW